MGARLLRLISGFILFAGALIVHVTLALSAVWQRRLLKLLTAEACKAFFGSLCRCSLRSNSRTLALLPRSAAGILVTMGAYRPRSGTVVPSTGSCR